MFCPKCGAENLNTSKFCKKCGKNLPDASQIRQAATLQFQTSGLLGQVLDGKYRIEAKLGSGGMGDVYRATRLLIGDSVAIKILHTHLAQDAQAAERFRREAVTATQLKHRNVVGLFDVGISAVYNVPYILMELAEGFSLRQIINQYRILPLDFVVTVTAQICSALDEAHRLGIVHRDIKPENIIANQTPNGWLVKVLDFGIAKLYNQADIGLTQDGSAMGTPQYMSPEQCMGEQIDGRGDIYSVGILVYEMLAGTVPFKSPSASAVAIHQVQTNPPPPRNFNPNIPPQIERIILKALEKRPEMRPQTASNFAQELIQAANFVFKSETANVYSTPISAPDVKPEFDVDGSLETAQKESHTLSSEILVEKGESTKIPSRKLKIGKRKEQKTEVLPKPSITDEPAPKESNIVTEVLLKPSEIVPEKPVQKDDLTLVFEVAEHILDEILHDQNQSSVETEVIPEIKPIAKPDEILWKPEISPQSKTETLVLENNSNEIQAVKQDEQILSAELDKTVYWQNTENKPKNKNFVFTAVALIFAVFLLVGAVIFGVWYFSGNGEKSSNSNVSAEIKPPAGMVYVKGGTFMMGGDSQEFGNGNFTSPPHEVTVKPFFMDIYEITCEEYKKFIDATGFEPPKNWNGKEFPKGAAKLPVTNVNWDAANAFAKWSGKRLPTEAEWEFAARGTDGRLYPWGNEWRENQSNANKIKSGMVEVGTFKGASPFGIYDLIGNAWEWTATNLEPYPNGNMPEVKPNIDYKIIRGGSWDSSSKIATATRRGFYGAREEGTYANTSFRCVKDAVEK